VTPAAMMPSTALRAACPPCRRQAVTRPRLPAPGFRAPMRPWVLPPRASTYAAAHRHIGLRTRATPQSRPGSAADCTGGRPPDGPETSCRLAPTPVAPFRWVIAALLHHPEHARESRCCRGDGCGHELVTFTATNSSSPTRAGRLARDDGHPAHTTRHAL
jgi:hypothetical protein